MTMKRVTVPVAACERGHPVRRAGSAPAAGSDPPPRAPGVPLVAMTGSLACSVDFYRQECGFAVAVDQSRQLVVLMIGLVGAITAPATLFGLDTKPVIRHPGGDRCTVLTRGVAKLASVERTNLLRLGITVADSGSGVVLPMRDNDPSVGWLWYPRPLAADPVLEAPSVMLDLLVGRSPKYHRSRR